MYLRLSDFDHLRDDPSVRFIEQVVDGVPVVIVSYMISNDDLWEKELGCECRGITFDASTGELISLPFEKFFNVNEKAWTQESVVVDHPIRFVADKRDGSMITAAIINDKVFLKTKKSFYSDVAIAAQRDMPINVEEMCRFMLNLGFCPIFEYTSPDAKIVINYGEEPQFTLLAVRDMKNGQYLHYPEIKYYTDLLNVPVIDVFSDLTVTDLLEQAATTEGIEGWVVYTDKGQFKVKTQWYIDRHRLLDIRIRDIAKFVLDEKIDDMIPTLLASEVDMEIVYDVEREVANDLKRIMRSIDELSMQATSIPIGKERADWVNCMAGDLSKFVHRAARGSDNSDEAIRDYYRQKHISKFPLRSIGNPNFGGDE